jgi:branched-chain amino acid transport system permease protein
MFALMLTRLGMPFLVVLPLSILGSFVIGLLLAIPLIRLRGHFLALGTFAMGMCIYLYPICFPALTAAKMACM